MVQISHFLNCASVSLNDRFEMTSIEEILQRGYHSHVHLVCHGKKHGTRAFVISHGGHRTKYLCVKTWDENRLLGKLKVKTADERKPSDKLH